MNNSNTNNLIMLDLIPLSRFGDYYPYPSVGALRQYIFYADKYKFGKVYKKIANRIYISISEFNRWVLEQNQEEIHHE